MEGLSLSEIFTLIAAGASVAIAAVAIGLSVVYFFLANRLFRKTEETVDEIEKSVNQMYGAFRAFSFSCLVGKAHHVESFAEMGIVAA